MESWKKWLNDLPGTLAAIFLISVIGLGIAHPGLFHTHHIERIVSAIADLVHTSNLPG
jgi:hypothetical protein